MRSAGLADRQGICFPTHVGGFAAGVQAYQVAQAGVAPDLHVAVAQRPLQQIGKVQLGQSLLPAGIGRIDLLANLFQLDLGIDCRYQTLGTQYEKLYLPLDLRLAPIQRLADCLLEIRLGSGRNDQFVDAFLPRKTDTQFLAHRLSGPRLVLRPPQLLLVGHGDQAGLDSHPGAGRQRQQVGLQGELEHVAGRKDQVVARETDPQDVAGRPPRQQPVPVRVEFPLVELTRQTGQGDFQLNRFFGGPVCRGHTGRRQLHQELRVQRSAEKQVHAVVGPSGPLADHQPPALNPHRSRLVGLDAQRSGLRDGALAVERDRCVP